MRVQIANTLLQIDFHKEHRTKGKKDLIDTFCIIYEVLKQKRTIAIGRTNQNPLDKYNKIVGKKIALHRALNPRFSGPITKKDLDYYSLSGVIDGDYCELFSKKENRTKIWNTFHTTFKRWR